MYYYVYTNAFGLGDQKLSSKLRELKFVMVQGQGRLAQAQDASLLHTETLWQPYL